LLHEGQPRSRKTIKMDDSKKLLIDALLTSAGQINAVIVGGIILCCAAIGLRLVGKNEMTVWNVPLKLSYFPLLAVLLTIAHAYTAGLMELRVSDMLSVETDVRQLAWKKLTTNGPIIFQGMAPRTLLKSFSLPVIGSIRVYEFSRSDYTTALSLLMAFGVIAAVVASSLDFRIANWRMQFLWRRQFAVVIVAVATGLANWTIGSWWAVEISKIYVG
jgi:hypothetical protein